MHFPSISLISIAVTAIPNEGKYGMAVVFSGGSGVAATQVRLRESMTKVNQTSLLQPNFLLLTIRAKFSGPILTIGKIKRIVTFWSKRIFAARMSPGCELGAQHP